MQKKYFNTQTKQHERQAQSKMKKTKQKKTTNLKSRPSKMKSFQS